MKKTVMTIAAVTLVAFASVSLFANAKLLTQHKTMKGSKKIATCNDCHNAITKLEKKKGQNYKALYKTKSCAGAGCHK